VGKVQWAELCDDPLPQLETYVPFAVASKVANEIESVNAAIAMAINFMCSPPFHLDNRNSQNITLQICSPVRGPELIVRTRPPDRKLPFNVRFTPKFDLVKLDLHVPPGLRDLEPNG
jgi:hypothetical protein